MQASLRIEQVKFAGNLVQGRVGRIQQVANVLAEVIGAIRRAETGEDVGYDASDRVANRTLQIRCRFKFNLLASIEQRATQEGPLQVLNEGIPEFISLLALL